MSPPPPITIRPIPPSSTHALRHSVLWPHKPLEYVILDEDEQGWHFGAFLASPEAPQGDGQGAGEGEELELGEPVSVISCFLEPLPEDLLPSASSSSTPRTGRFRKFATSPAHQRQGIGRALLLYTLRFLTSLPDEDRNSSRGGKGVRRVWCDARWEKRGFYERVGMTAVRPPPRDAHEGGEEGPTFYKGDIPYVRMVLDVEDLQEGTST
ncbi:hypothetical protein CALCODRAFT_493533 [Calocera cornea HHB12733]|uniref:N-acetyltransferase domain-containing protein n=1 Tax=Calocera cornea HHB12733 TaxID=1353952 RepID=A0A165HPX6_9BASI|nr:hypothetical protein CALCODRAFT_493533 [Calocera cornea HHB12733]